MIDFCLKLDFKITSYVDVSVFINDEEPIKHLHAVLRERKQPN